MMIRLLSVLLFLPLSVLSQEYISSADILHSIKKLEVHGSVLYIAAHPDDENTRLLSYLANERKYRTGYLSLTRGDGGQNLIGDEQGIELGLIRTQELLAARKVDGAEQFFSSAYDFGYSKNPQETFSKWDHDKILGEVVYIIRKFKPDVIITRFPSTGEGGHGHHTASAILAEEAFKAAADTKQFTDKGEAWVVKRIFWNTFNFGNNNTTREDQLKIDVGAYNALLGMSYGEMAAESRSNHKSQGFGVPAQRGAIFEYFSFTAGVKHDQDLFDDINTSVSRYGQPADFNDKYQQLLKKIISEYNFEAPYLSLPALQQLYAHISSVKNNSFDFLKNRLKEIIFQASGIFMEAVTQSAVNSKGDTAKVNFTFNNRTGVAVSNVSANLFGRNIRFDKSEKNSTSVQTEAFYIPFNLKSSQPYWLEEPLGNGSYLVKDKELTGLAENHTYVTFNLSLNGQNYQLEKPLLYKFTDPVKGEVYQPAVFAEPVHISVSPAVVLMNSNSPQKEINVTIKANTDLQKKVTITLGDAENKVVLADTMVNWKKQVSYNFNFSGKKPGKSREAGISVMSEGLPLQQNGFKKIAYDHIPAITYEYKPSVKIITADIKTVGKTAGYIAGAGDKVPEALTQLGYKVIMLGEQDIKYATLKELDVIVTGIRAYNIHSWLSNAYNVLMKYVEEGGALLVQYNTNSSIGPVRAGISPYPFTITRNRITDETASVKFLQPEHPVLNYPNKITQNDFNGWIQERSIYNAETSDPNFVKVLGMNDPGENMQDGSLLFARYGKGKFIYTGLVFFRELPAGVEGAYRLFANLIANNK